MGNTTPTQALPYPYEGDVIDAVSMQNLANAMVTSLDARDVQRAAMIHRPNVWAQNTGTAIAANTETVLGGFTAAYDPYGLFTASNSAMTIPAGNTGLWRVELYTQSLPATNIRTQFAMKVNGTTQVERTFSGANQFNETNYKGVVLVPTGSGNTITITALSKAADTVVAVVSAYMIVHI